MDIPACKGSRQCKESTIPSERSAGQGNKSWMELRHPARSPFSLRRAIHQGRRSKKHHLLGLPVKAQEEPNETASIGFSSMRPTRPSGGRPVYGVKSDNLIPRLRINPSACHLCHAYHEPCTHADRHLITHSCEAHGMNCCGWWRGSIIVCMPCLRPTGIDTRNVRGRGAENRVCMLTLFTLPMLIEEIISERSRKESAGIWSRRPPVVSESILRLPAGRGTVRDGRSRRHQHVEAFFSQSLLWPHAWSRREVGAHFRLSHRYAVLLPCIDEHRDQ